MLYSWHPIGGAPDIKQTDCVLLNGGDLLFGLWGLSRQSMNMYFQGCAIFRIELRMP